MSGVTEVAAEGGRRGWPRRRRQFTVTKRGSKGLKRVDFTAQARPPTEIEIPEVSEGPPGEGSVIVRFSRAETAAGRVEGVTRVSRGVEAVE